MKHLISILLLLFSMAAIGQNVTIDYQAWNPSGTTCSLFVNPTNVPATGTASGTIEHQRKLGQTVYSNSDSSIQMQTVYQTTGGVSQGARFRIAYNFKAGYSYMIYVTAAAIENTVGLPTGPFMRLDVNNNGGGGSTGCNGPETVNYNPGGSPAAVKLSSNSFQEFQFVFPALGTQPTLEITAFPEVNGGTKTVRVRKIRIVETPPSTSFSITPASVPITCGSTTPVTFTVNNGGGTTGITGYTWNLGATPNGWLLPNGTPAPTTYSTGTTSTLTLTPVCGFVQKNVSATVAANAINYNTTNSGTVSITQPSLSINGNSTLCSGTTNYSINNLPCNATVQWQASPADIVTINSPNSPQTTITMNNNGVITLTAVISNACNGQIPVSIENINIGIQTPTNIVGLNPPLGVRPGELLELDAAENASSYSWSVQGGAILGYSNQSHVTIQVDQCQGQIYNGWINVQLAYTNACGTGYFGEYTTIECGTMFAMSPNPATDHVTIDGRKKNKSIKEIQIMDKLGNVKQVLKYSGDIKVVNFNISVLPSDIYYVKIFDGLKWESKQLKVQ